MSKKNGVAGGEHAETLAKSVHGQQECPEDVPVWHTLNTSPSHGSCSRACACEGQTGMATEGWPHSTAPLWTRVRVLAEQGIGAAVLWQSTWGWAACDGSSPVFAIRGRQVCVKGSSTFPLCSLSTCQDIISGALVFQGGLWSSCWSASSDGSLKNKTSLVSHHHCEMLPSWTWVWPCSFQDRQNVRILPIMYSSRSV